MKLYYGGAEQKGWRELLYDNGVRDMSLSFVGLLRRTRKPDEFLLRDNFPDDVNIFVDSGAYSLNKPDSTYTSSAISLLAEQYEQFIAANIDRLTMFSQYDAIALDPVKANGLRNRFNQEYPDKFLPIWKTANNVPLRDAVANNSRMGILGSEAKQLTAQLNRVVMDFDTKLHGVAMTQMKLMKEVGWDSVGSLSWLSPSINGDTIIWDGHELKRYPKDYKGRGRAAHKRWLQDHGFDWSLIDDDDSTELLRVSVWSWQEFVKHIDSTQRVTQMAETHDSQNEERENSAVAHNEVSVRNEPGTRKLLPILRTEYDEHIELDEDGNEIRVRTPKIKASDESLMQCNTCVIQDRCPEFTPGASCAFDIPVNLAAPKAEDEFWTTITEIQGQRVLMMRMIEQVSGSGFDPNVGPEIDRLMRIMNAKKKQQNTTIRRVEEISVSGGQGGIISGLFGEAAGNKLHPQIEAGNDEDVQDAEIISDSEDNDE